MNNIILADVDGVLLNWWDPFVFDLRLQSYKQEVSGEYCTAKSFGISKRLAEDLEESFNHSPAIGNLPPLRDAVKYIRKLHEEYGLVLHCITAMPNIDYVYSRRLSNLQEVFGKSVIQRLVCTGSSAAKRPVLAKYAGLGIPWVEDKYQNASMGTDYGLNCFLIEHDYNKNFGSHGPNIKRVQNWKQIYTQLKGK